MGAAVKPDVQRRFPVPKCSACVGNGWVLLKNSGGQRSKCKFCNGSGRMTCRREDIK